MSSVMGGSTQHSGLVVGAAVVDSLARPRLLLCAARAYPPELAGRYELPGGKVERGETPTEALARELAEELDLAVTLGDELVPPADCAVPVPTWVQAEGAWPADDAPSWPVLRGLRMRVWLAQPAKPGDEGHLGSSHSRLDWVPLGEAPSLPWLDADIPIARAIVRRLGA